MTTGVRVLSRLQLPPDLLARFRADDDSDDEAPDVVFYTGCNLLKTPHIALLCFDIMDALGVRYRVMGGPSHCCGVLQFRAGDLATSGRIAYRTVERLAAARATACCHGALHARCSLARWSSRARPTRSWTWNRSCCSWPRGWMNCGHC